jgi:hypothetical protein
LQLPLRGTVIIAGRINYAPTCLNEVFDPMLRQHFPLLCSMCISDNCIEEAEDRSVADFTAAARGQLGLFVQMDRGAGKSRLGLN